MQAIGGYLVAVTFWIFVGAVAIAGMVYDYKRRRTGMELLRMAIEKGQPLDPALVDKLTSYEREDPPVQPVQIKIGGIITIAGAWGCACCHSFSAECFPLLFTRRWERACWWSALASDCSLEPGAWLAHAMSSRATLSRDPDGAGLRARRGFRGGRGGLGNERR